MSNEVKTWFKIILRLLSTVNGRVEAAVKSMKHLLNGNARNKNSIDTDQNAQALIQHHNTPLRDINILPAQLSLGGNL